MTPHMITLAPCRPFQARVALLTAAVLATLALAACDRPATVVVPAVVTVPGPAGPAGETGAQGNQGNQGAMGMQGNDGNQGAMGKPGGGTTVIVVPPGASAPTN